MEEEIVYRDVSMNLIEYFRRLTANQLHALTRVHEKTPELPTYLFDEEQMADDFSAFMVSEAGLQSVCHWRTKDGEPMHAVKLFYPDEHTNDWKPEQEDQVEEVQ